MDDYLVVASSGSGLEEFLLSSGSGGVVIPDQFFLSSGQSDVVIVVSGVAASTPVLGLLCLKLGFITH